MQSSNNIWVEDPIDNFVVGSLFEWLQKPFDNSGWPSIIEMENFRQTSRKITDDWEVSQDVLPWSSLKPPNEVWVEVQDKNEVIEAMAFYGRDGYSPHWQLRDGSSCHPSRFNKWRFFQKDNEPFSDSTL